jgi:predicted neutral ceramidase superfamily lipid hydrolase
MATARGQATQLSGLDRILLVLPLLGGLVFGLTPLVAPRQFAQAAGAPGNDPYIYRLAGAATFGYAAALAWALLSNSWARARLLVIATLAFNVGSLYACGVAIAGGQANAPVYLILVTSVIIVVITGWLLYQHRSAPRPAPDIAPWLTWFLVAATLLSVPFALLPLFFPVQFGQYFGLQATGGDLFVYRQGGAALLGYAMLGVFEVRSRSWSEVRSAAVMVVVFNTLAALVSIAVLLGMLPDKGGTLAPIVAVAAGLVAVATIAELARGGK